MLSLHSRASDFCALAHLQDGRPQMQQTTAGETDPEICILGAHKMRSVELAADETLSGGNSMRPACGH